MDLHGGLIVSCGGEDLRLLGRNGGIGIDQPSHHTAHSLDTEREWGDIKEEDILHVSAEYATLDSRTECNDLIGVDSLGGILTEELLHQILDGRNTSRSTHEDDIINVRGRETCVCQCLIHRLDASLDDIVAELLKLSSRQGLHQVLWHIIHRGNVGEVDLRRGGAGELNLCLLSSVLEALQSHRVLAEIDILSA